MSVFSKMNQGTKKTPMIIAICSTIIACAFGVAFFTKSNDGYVTEDQVMELLASNYADNMTDEQMRTILKTVTSKVETDYSDLDLSSLLTKDNAAWLKSYISREVTEAAKETSVSPEKVKEITDLVVKQLEENQRQSLDSMAGKDEIMTSEINSVKQEIEEFRKVKSQLEEILKDTKDDSKISTAKETEARKRAIEQTEASIKTLKELIEKNKTTQSNELATKIKELESLIAKYKDSSSAENKSGVEGLLSQLNETNKSLQNEIESKNKQLEDLIKKNKEANDEAIKKAQDATNDALAKNKTEVRNQFEAITNEYKTDIQNVTTNIKNELEPMLDTLAQPYVTGNSYDKNDIFVYKGGEAPAGTIVKEKVTDQNGVESEKVVEGGLQKNHLYQVISENNAAPIYLDITVADKLAELAKEDVTFGLQDNGDSTYLLIVHGDIAQVGNTP